MKIVFCPNFCVPFHGWTLQEQPLGGIETAVIHLAAALDALGHEVIVLTHHPNPPVSKPRYLSMGQRIKLKLFDALIAVRGWRALFENWQCRKRFLWTGDSYTNPHTFGLGDKRVLSKIDALLCVSQWQADTLSQAAHFPSEKIGLLRNGIHLADFAGRETRQRKRLIYASNPQRGLIYLPSILLELRKKHPELELHIFSNAALYDMRWPPKVAVDLNAEAILHIFKDLQGCFVHGTVLQKQLAREFMKSAIWTYPCPVEETSCITALEAQAAGCASVTTAIGGLPETVGEAGILIAGKPESAEYQRQFIEVTDRLLSDDAYFQQFSQIALKRRMALDWKERAVELVRYLNEKHGLT